MVAGGGELVMINVGEYLIGAGIGGVINLIIAFFIIRYQQRCLK